MPRATGKLSTEDEEVWRAYTQSLAHHRDVRPTAGIYSTGSVPRSLDLHGHTLHSAWHAFAGFVRMHVEFRSRDAVVVTGGSGRIREEFEHWCADNPDVTGCDPMVSPRGKIGSFRVRFRRS